jgi:hypothetical protein
MLSKDLISKKISSIGFSKKTNLLNTDELGGLIILQLRENNYVLSEIARIVENENAKILSLATHLNANGFLYILLKVNTENINPILKSFERFNYEIDSYFTNSDNNETEMFQKRLNEFLHYMQI